MTWKSLLLFVGLYLGISFAVAIMIGIAIGYYESVAQQPEPYWLSMFNVLILDGIVFFILLFNYGKVRRFAAEAMEFSSLRRFSTYGYIAAAAVLVFFVQAVFIQLAHIDDASKQAGELGIDQLAGKGALSYLLAYFSIAILTPIKEEILFRGILHRFLERRYHFWVGFVVSSLVFGLLHFDFPVSAILMGAIFVMVYRLTKSLVPCILLHILWNSFSGAVQFLNS